MKKISNLIIHCSDSPFGDANLIDSWHKERGWKCIGYHFVITNGRRLNSKDYVAKDDGIIEKGRFLNDDEWIQDNEIGSHALGLNDRSIGICLIGKDQFTLSQWRSLITLCQKRIITSKINIDSVIGHNETQSGKQQGKTCPNFDVNMLRVCLNRNDMYALIPSNFM